MRHRKYSRPCLPVVWVGVFLAGCSLLPKPPATDGIQIVDQHIEAALIHEENGEWNGAVAEYKKVLATDEDNLQALTNLGNVYAQLKQFEEAEVYYRAVLQLDPDSPMVNNNLAWILVVQGLNLDEAGVLIQKAMHSDPERVSVYFDTQAFLYLKLNRFNKALQSLQAAENLLVPDDESMRSHLSHTRTVIQRAIKSRSDMDPLGPEGMEFPEAAP